MMMKIEAIFRNIIVYRADELFIRKQTTRLLFMFQQVFPFMMGKKRKILWVRMGQITSDWVGRRLRRGDNIC